MLSGSEKDTKKKQPKNSDLEQVLNDDEVDDLDLAVAAADPESRLMEAREAKKKLDEQNEQFQNDYLKVQQEIKQYKQAIIEQEKALRE